MILHQVMQFYVGAMVVAVVLPFYFWRRIGVVPALLWSAFLVHATSFGFELPVVESGQLKMNIGVNASFIKWQSLQYLLLLYIVPLYSLASNRLHMVVSQLLQTFVYANSIYIIYVRLFTDGNRGLIDVYTFDLALHLYLVAGLVWWGQLATSQRAGLIFILAVSLGLGGWSSWVVAAAMLGAFGVHWLATTGKLKLYEKGVTALVGLTAIYFIADAMASFFVSRYDVGGRAQIWADALGAFPVETWGHGVGAFRLRGIFNPDADGVRYLIAHNDFVQMFIELGPVMTALFFGTVLLMLVQFCRYIPTSFVMLSGFLALMFTYYPLHYPVPLVVAAYFVTDLFAIKSIRDRLKLSEYLEKKYSGA